MLAPLLRTNPFSSAAPHPHSRSSPPPPLTISAVSRDYLPTAAARRPLHSPPQPHSGSSPPPPLTISAVSRDYLPKTQPQPKISTATTTITEVSSPPQTSIAATICNTLDDFINTHIDPPHLRPSVNPLNVLSGNFAPVPELSPTPCPTIIGTIPRCLVGGAYIRNGPNPQHRPSGTYHLFDGDGMLHSLLLPTATNSTATLSSHYVRTYKYIIENTAGASVIPNVFAGFHGFAGLARSIVIALRVLSNQIDLREGVGLANTSLAIINNTMYALSEADLPYAVHVSPTSGAVTTVGRSNLNGQLNTNMTAHPKHDPDTGECFAFRWSVLPPFVTYFRFDRNGQRIGPDVSIPVRQPTLLHDFAVTDRYVIFPDIQIVMKPLDMLMGQGPIVGVDKNKVARLGVLPRYAAEAADMQWFDTPDFNIFHVINAWEEGDTIVLVAPNVTPIEHSLERLDLIYSCVEMVRINLRSGSVSRTVLAQGNLDFGVINPGYSCRRNRYAYLGVGGPFPKVCGLVKLDFEKAATGQECVVARRNFGPSQFCGEPFFVGDGGEGEDDGYLVTYLHDEQSEESRFVVMDARSSELEVVAEVLLPRKVPYGFHGMFVSGAELHNQGKSSPEL